MALLWLVGAALALSACRAQEAPAMNGNGAVNEAANDLEDAVANVTESVSLNVSWSRIGSGARVIIKSNESQTIHLQRIIVNGQDDDPNCRINIFRDLISRQETEVSVPSCGDINSVQVFTDRGQLMVSWNSFQRSVETATDNTPGYRTTTIRNVGPAEWTVNRVTLNQQTNDPQCVIRVFQPVPPQGAITVATNTCGQINQLEVETTAGTAIFDVRPPGSYDTSTNAM